MSIPATFLFRVGIVFYYITVNYTDSLLISKVFDDILKINTIHTRYHNWKSNSSSSKSKYAFYDLCYKIPEVEYLLGCCKPYNVKILDDVMIMNGEFHTNLKTTSPVISLPPISSSYYRQVSTFSVKVVNDHHYKVPSSCSKYFNGTLHVSSRGTVHNLFHALNDNVLPLMAQIVTDLAFWRELAELPRMALVGFHVPAHHRAPNRAQESSIPHMALFNELFSGGTISMTDAKGMCFRRVVWGTGLRIHYVDAMVAQRRLTADFARAFVLRAYNPAVPPAFASSAHRQGPLTRSGRAMNVLLISRGTTGLGRTIQNEMLILSKLHAAGASVFLLGDDRGNMTHQLSLALHADVIVGLHGAGLVQGIFAPRGCILVELKTLYGYQSDIFAKTSDARLGMHVHLDVRKYSTPGVVHRVDEALADRVLKSIVIALDIQKEGNTGKVTKISTTNDDYVISPSKNDDELSDFLGPLSSRAQKVCEDKLPYLKFRGNVLKGDRLEYCSKCGLD